MGIPGFFKWLSEKHSQSISKAKVKTYDEENFNSPVNLNDPNPNGQEFHALFLDLTSLLHISCRRKKKWFKYKKNNNSSENQFEEILEDFCDSIFVILRTIRPKELVYFALDGIAPRAKLNQQRERRFAALKLTNQNKQKEKKDDQSEKIENLEFIKNENLESKSPKTLNELEFTRIGKLEISEPIPASSSQTKKTFSTNFKIDFKNFDTNLITAGTPFLKEVSIYLHKWVKKIIEENAFFQKVKMIVSDSTVPGEGEHKLMDFWREWKSQKDYSPDKNKVFYGADADLVMLSLSLQEDNIFILREDPNNIKCQKCKQIGHTTVECNGQSPFSQTTIHLSGLNSNVREHDLIDQFSIFGNIVEIRLPISDNLTTKGYAFIEYDSHESALLAINSCHGTKFCGSKLSVDFAKEKKQNSHENGCIKSDEKLVQFQNISGLNINECIQFLENAHWNLEGAISLFFDPTATPEDLQLQRDLLNISKLESGNPNIKEEKDFQNHPLPDFIFISMKEVRNYLVNRMGIQTFKKKFSKKNLIDDFISICYFGGNDFLPGLNIVDITGGGVELLLEKYKEYADELGTITEDRRIQPKKMGNLLNRIVISKLAQIKFLPPNPQLFREGYYKTQFGDFSEEFVKEICHNFYKGLIWMNQYYFFGCPSWEWFYPYHYAPLAGDLAFYLNSIENEKINFEIGNPLSPIQQLMAVLPIESAKLCLPKPYIEKMENELKDFYVYKKEKKNQSFKKKGRQTGKVLLPFLDQILLKKVEGNVTEQNPEYKLMNEVGRETIYMSNDFDK